MQEEALEESMQRQVKDLFDEAEVRWKGKGEDSGGFITATKDAVPGKDWWSKLERYLIIATPAPESQAKAFYLSIPISEFSADEASLLYVGYCRTIDFQGVTHEADCALWCWLHETMQEKRANFAISEPVAAERTGAIIFIL